MTQSTNNSNTNGILQIKKGYKGNKLIKSAGEQVSWDPEKIREYLKCKNDVEYFIENYVKIIHVDRGLISFALYPYQKKILKNIINNRFTIFKLPRQSGKSVAVGGYILHYILFNEEKNVAILANKSEIAKKMLAAIKKSYEYLPKWLQQGVLEWNKTSIELENGCKIKATATASDAARGESYSLVILDEFAHVERNQQDPFFTSVFPTISSGKETKVVIISTPNGMELFYKIWTDSVEGRSEFKNMEIHWSETPGRDEKWKEQQLMIMDQLRFDQEYGTEFLGSSNTLLSGACLRSLSHKTPKHLIEDGLAIYEEPIVPVFDQRGNPVQEGHSYVVLVDSSQGVGIDSSALSVIDVTNTPYKQVAVYRNNLISPVLFPDLIYRVAMKYNTAAVLIEVTDASGVEVANNLYRNMEYENIIFVTSRGRKGQVAEPAFAGSKSSQYGVKMSPAVKRLGCTVLKDLMEKSTLLVQDYNTINEFSTFTLQKNTYKADPGCHDDIVMSLVLFAWLTTQPVFKHISGGTIQDGLYRNSIQRMDTQLMPIGFSMENIKNDIFERKRAIVEDDGTVWYEAGTYTFNGQNLRESRLIDSDGFGNEPNIFGLL